MFPVREQDFGEDRYQQELVLVRERILAFVLRRLVPHLADFAQAEDIAQSCVIVLWEQYPDKRDPGEMLRIAIGTARHKIAQFHRDRARMPESADPAESRAERNPHGGERIFERLAARQETDRLLIAMLKLPARCRELLAMKLLEQKSYDEIRAATGISGNIYEIARRCFRTLLRSLGGPTR